MQKGIIIKDGNGNVIFKGVYAGNLGIADSEAARLTAKYPSYTVTEYNSDQDTGFADAVYSNPDSIVIS